MCYVERLDDGPLTATGELAGLVVGREVGYVQRVVDVRLLGSRCRHPTHPTLDVLHPLLVEPFGFGLEWCVDVDEDHERHSHRSLLDRRLILEMVKKQIPELDWQVVHRLEDLPEGAPVLEAGQVLRGSWQREGDDSQLRQVRWYRREQHSLVFTPTKTQLDEWDAARDRARGVRSALIERHRDQLPTFAGRSLDDWDAYYAERKGQEDEIAKDFDTEREAATHQFYRGDYRWLATLNAAISDLGIPEDEVEELRTRTEARIAEAEATLRTE